ncbi:formate dehydrogenase accessory sulfurtransferase FdhD [Robiginitalea sediminis]|uniref:formate dehydrogenase accessory sulfurtransferase FdhD n=1 Tax=Robiginitalea sediminis TaxID=1982593 RepID=UPI000B4B9123|nr:formate dehydrogenase accessory sulfurtransferase FdhD [Robiginitalea sediminis]
MATRTYQGKKFDAQGVTPVEDALTVEEALEIRINGKPFSLTMRTPGADRELIRGMLHAEAVINTTGYHPEVRVGKATDKGVVSEVDLKIPEAYLGDGYANTRSLLSVSSCGICGKTELDQQGFDGPPPDAGVSFEASRFPELFAQMNQRQHDFQQSGGTHAAALFDSGGALLAAREDIGRHNAVDKVVGQLLLEGRLPQARVMTVSGRISYEIVIKAFKAGIPFLAAVSAPSSLAVDYAKELGITLMGFCREGRATCYSHAYRLINQRVPARQTQSK